MIQLLERLAIATSYTDLSFIKKIQGETKKQELQEKLQVKQQVYDELCRKNLLYGIAFFSGLGLVDRAVDYLKYESISSFLKEIVTNPSSITQGNEHSLGYVAAALGMATMFVFGLKSIPTLNQSDLLRHEIIHLNKKIDKC